MILVPQSDKYIQSVHKTEEAINSLTANKLPRQNKMPR